MTSYEALGLERAINASGRMTKLGGSILTPEVLDAMARGGAAHVVVDDLAVAAGRRVAQLLGAEDAAITSSASAGLACAVAALIAGTDLSHIHRLPADIGRPREVVLQRGHSVDWGAPATQMVALGGGLPVEVGSVNRTDRSHVEGAIGPDTAALLYIQSHHTVHKGMLSFAEMLDIGRTHGIPVIVDAAAEEDLQRWASSGASMVIFSGTKAIGGPISGIVCGSREHMDGVRAQSAGIARPMKVGKEQTLGLLAALEAFLNADTGSADTIGRRRERMHALATHFDAVEGVTATVAQDDAGRDIHRAVLSIGPSSRTTAPRVAAELAAGSPPIFLRDSKAAAGVLEIDPRPLSDEEELLVVERLDQIFDAAREGVRA